MADDVDLTGAQGVFKAATDEVAGRHFQLVKLAHGEDGAATLVSPASGLPVSGPLTDTQLRATAVPVSDAGGSITVDGTVGISGTVPVSGPLTDAQLRAVAVPVSDAGGSITVDGTVGISGTVPVSGPLTDSQLRAAAVPVSDAGGSITVDGTVGISGTVPVSGPLTDAQLRATAVPVVAAALPLPAGAATDAGLATLATVAAGQATEASLAGLSAKVPVLATRPVDNEAPGVPVRPIGQEIWNVSFSEVGASVISPQMRTPVVGTGVGFSQANGALAITAGTAANAEFLTRSVAAWRGSLRLRASTVLSQRIANNNFAILLADLVGESLAFTINSAISVTVTRPAHGLTAQNVGQFMLLGAIVGAAGVPGRYAIAAVPTADTITFTVAGWPASGSGTLTLFGHSYLRNLYNGVTATAVAVDAQRRGWASGDTTATINTTASPGHVLQVDATGREVLWADALRASSTTPNFTTRASRIENLPDDNLDLYVWVWSFNGTAAPATGTTWTMSFLAVEKFANTPVFLQGVRAQGAANPLPVAVQGTAAVSGTVTANIGTGALAAGANTIGQVRLAADAGQGAGTFLRRLLTADTNLVSVKATAGQINTLALHNDSATKFYFKLYNLAAAPVLASSTPVMTIPVPANSMVQIDCGPYGIRLATGIAIAVVRGIADTDTTAVALNDGVVHMVYT